MRLLKPQLEKIEKQEEKKLEREKNDRIGGTYEGKYFLLNYLFGFFNYMHCIDYTVVLKL